MWNPLARWFERRAVTLSPADGAWFTGGVTAAGVTVSPTTALSVPAVFACLTALSQDIGRTPIKLRRQTAPDTFTDAVDHPLYEILASLPNPEQDAYTFKRAMQWQLLSYGRAYAEIVRHDGRVTALWPLDASGMRVDRDEQRRKRWTYVRGGQTFVWRFDPSTPPIFELNYESPIQSCREAIGTALALQAYIAKFFANSALPAGVVTVPGRLTTDQRQALREQWQAGYQGVSQAHRTAIFDSGMDFKTLAMTHDSAQLAETLKALSMAICGAFRVPPHKAGLMESTNYSNAESFELSYITSTLDPLFESWELALRRDLLTARQYGAYTVSFDRSALIRNDQKSLYDSLSRGIQNGFLSQNDARRALGLNPIPDGDVFMINSALQPVGAPHVV